MPDNSMTRARYQCMADSLDAAKKTVDSLEADLNRSVTAHSVLIEEFEDRVDAATAEAKIAVEALENENEELMAAASGRLKTFCQMIDIAHGMMTERDLLRTEASDA